MTGPATPPRSPSDGQPDEAPGAGLGLKLGLRLGMALVRGDSMLPTLRAGDRLLVRYDARVRPGAVVLARLPDRTLAVKRAIERRTAREGAEAWWLLSDNPEAGVDSRHRGPISAADVRGRAVLRLWPWPRLL